MIDGRTIEPVNFERLSPQIVECIREHTSLMWKQYKLDEQFINPLLREDVLELLDGYCTVIYFPLEDEKNNGFHITDAEDKDGKPNEFVFINTAQTMEKQVFTAAHELGHIWNVDKAVAEKLKIKMTDEMQERIMNCFAAELLMPSKQFLHAFIREATPFRTEASDEVSVVNVFRIIAKLMNEFFVPYKSIVRRLYELNKIHKDALDVLSGGHQNLSEGEIETVMSVVIKENGYTKLQQKWEKKWIDGFAELLEDAERKETICQSKIDKMRELFSLEPTSPNKYLEESLTLESDKDMRHEN